MQRTWPCLRELPSEWHPVDQSDSAQPGARTSLVSARQAEVPSLAKNAPVNHDERSRRLGSTEHLVRKVVAIRSFVDRVGGARRHGLQHKSWKLQASREQVGKSFVSAGVRHGSSTARGRWSDEACRACTGESASRELKCRSKMMRALRQTGRTGAAPRNPRRCKRPLCSYPTQTAIEQEGQGNKSNACKGPARPVTKRRAGRS